MVTGPDGPETNIDYAGEDVQQLTARARNECENSGSCVL